MQNKDKTPSACTLVKNHSPPSLEKPDKPQKRLNLEVQSMEVDLQLDNPNLAQDNSIITRSNEMENATRQHRNLDSSTTSDDTRSNNMPTSVTSSNMDDKVITERHKSAISSNNMPISDDQRTEAKVKNPFQMEEPDGDGESLEDLGPELAKMGRILAREITKSLSKALIPLQNEISELKTANMNTGSIEQWQQLKDENDKLNTKVHQLELRKCKLQQKLNQIEDKLVDNNLLFFGITEVEGESEQDRYAVVLEVISSTFIGQTHDVRMQQARNVMIESLVRKGRFNQRKSRPISVTFTHQRDVGDILMNQKYLPEGVFVSKEYGEHTEHEQKLLKPILRAANNIKEYKRRCQMEGDHIVIKGRHYNRDNLSDLPSEISGFKVTSKENPETVGFFGELNPLSNFHKCVFKVDDTWYHSAEQYIQQKKAEYFNDHQSPLKILTAESAIECKQLACEIKIYDVTKWKDVAESECFEGVFEKFNQNLYLNECLQKTDQKTIIESSYDRTWGTGVPLHSPDALNSNHWIGDNLLGKILINVRETLRNQDDVD